MRVAYIRSPAIPGGAQTRHPAVLRRGAQPAVGRGRAARAPHPADPGRRERRDQGRRPAGRLPYVEDDRARWRRAARAMIAEIEQRGRHGARPSTRAGRSSQVADAAWELPAAGGGRARAPIVGVNRVRRGRVHGGGCEIHHHASSHEAAQQIAALAALRAGRDAAACARRARPSCRPPRRRTRTSCPSSLRPSRPTPPIGEICERAPWGLRRVPGGHRSTERRAASGRERGGRRRSEAALARGRERRRIR